VIGDALGAEVEVGGGTLGVEAATALEVEAVGGTLERWRVGCGGGRSWSAPPRHAVGPGLLLHDTRSAVLAAHASTAKRGRRAARAEATV
jgi:hypothetical protein